MAVLFVIAKGWKLKYPSVADRLNTYGISTQYGAVKMKLERYLYTKMTKREKRYKGTSFKKRVKYKYINTSLFKK